MLRAALELVTDEVAKATTFAATSFYQGAKNLATDIGDYYHRQTHQLTQSQLDAAERKARNAKHRADLQRHRLLFEADHNKANPVELANFKKEIDEQLQKTNAELTALSTPYFLTFTRSGAINLKNKEKDILLKLSTAKTMASLKLLAQEQSEFVVKNSPLDLLLDRIRGPYAVSPVYK